MVRSILVSAAVAFVMSVPAAADPAGDTIPDVQPLTVGDKAPALQIAHWVKGREITGFDPGKIYVVEFWATWCGPCRMSMPHITELQSHYKDYGVTFLGISDEPLQTVSEFLKKDEWSAKTGYTVATDPDRSAYFSYMLASGNEGIPTAFVVGKGGLIEWIGHPVSIDEPLEAVVKGTWDRKAFFSIWEPEAAPKRERTMSRIAFEKARMAGDFPRALSIVEQWIAAQPEEASYQYLKFTLLLKSMNEPERAYTFGREMVKSQWDDPEFLNRVAWFVVDDKGVATRDLPFAMKAATRANELTGQEEPAILDTLARICFDSGDVATAIKWQKRAVENADSAPMKEELTKTLARYQDAAKN